jgi:hypothetical protein
VAVIVRDRWPAAAFVLIALGLLVLAMPASVEGPVLLPISPGHAVSRLDALGIVPLVAGSCWLYGGLWRRRARLYARAAASPGAAGGAIFVAGLGLGLLLASAFSAFFWWWAVGAAAFGIVLARASQVAARQ